MQSDSIQQPHPRNGFDRIAYPLLPVFLFLLYLPTLARGVTFSDGGEITAAVVTLGVIHPTGYPIFTIIAHLFVRLLPLPIEPCIKIELLNTLFACTAAWLTARTLRDLAAHAESGPPGSSRDASIAGLAAGLLLGISPLLWHQARIPEVYPFHVLLVAWAGYVIARFEITRGIKYIVWSAIPLGLGLAHHVTIVYFLPALLVYLLVRRPSFFIALGARAIAFARRRPPGPLARDFWAFPLACLLGALPLCSYAYLLWANSHTSGIPWGDVHDFTSLYNHITGVQYRGLVATGTSESFLKRLIQLHAHFDRQFIAIGTVFFFIGIPALVRRLPGYSIFILTYFLLNIAHGIFYNVGDYANYFLPSVYGAALFIAFGMHWSLRRIRTRHASRRVWLLILALSLIALAASPILYFYIGVLGRLPWFSGAKAGLYTAAPPLILGLCGILAALAVRKRRPAAALESAKLAGALGPALLAAYLPIALTRAHGLAREPLIAPSFGREVHERVPDGSILLTQGDGHLFTLWYFQHALGLNVHTAVIDVANTTTGFYLGYLRSRHPAACDPVLPGNKANPIEFERRCRLFSDRKQTPPPPWLKIDQTRVRTGTWTMRPQALNLPLPRGTDAKCSEEAFRNENGALCACWYYPSRAFVTDEECIASSEEGGIVARSFNEVQIHRIIEDHIDERPVFERNALTFWENNVLLNSRRWKGPAYQRLSADYAMINRGRVNQIVYTSDIIKHSACGPQFIPIQLRSPRPPRIRGTDSRRRRPYREGGIPIVLAATFLTAGEQDSEDLSARGFAPDQSIYMHLQWFERFYFDSSAEDKRGLPIRHGLRACVYNPQNQRIAAVHLLSGSGNEKSNTIQLLSQASARPAGIYHFQICTTGELGPYATGLDDPQPCTQTIAEDSFTIDKQP